MRKTKKIPVELSVSTEEKPERNTSVASSPLFGSLVEDSEEILDHIVIYREKPIREGQLGTLAANTTEDDIRAQYGGGTFKLIGRTEKRKPISGAFTTIDLAGDPIFTNEVSKRRWEKIKRAELGDEITQPSSGGMLDPVALEEARHAREIARIRAEAEANLRRAEAEIAAKEAADQRRRDREREERRAEAEEREQRAEERRQREREERAEERRQDREERRREWEERIAAEERRYERERAERAAEREARADPMTQFATMAQIFGALQGAGEPGDPITAAVSRLPEILQEARETGAALAAGVKRDSGTRADKAGVHLDGETARKAMGAINAIKAAGADPDAVLKSMFDKLSQVKRRELPTPKGNAPAKKTGKKSEGS